MSKPRVTIIPAGAPMATCARCNLSAADDGARFKIHGGKSFICQTCKPR